MKTNQNVRMGTALSIAAMASIWGLSAGDAQAWAIYNNSNVNFRVHVFSGDEHWERNIDAYSENSCNYGNADCNPSQDRDHEVNVWIKTHDTNDRDIFWAFSMEAGDWVKIYNDPWKGPHCTVYAWQNGEARASYPRLVTATKRNVRFLASADFQCLNGDGQFDDTVDAHGGTNQWANDVNGKMIDMLRTNSSIRGIVYAGDLTGYARPKTEFKWYKESIAPFDRFVYDGIGNHDAANPPITVGQELACLLEEGVPGWDSCRDPGAISGEIWNRKRDAAKRSKDPSHSAYSWDWHDVHFVQLGIYPEAGLLTYLRDELRDSVGRSGRPVILTHHYGFDGFSLTASPPADVWWTDTERIAYWNVIASYNVIGIFTGHAHLSPGEKYRFDWRRPSVASGGPEMIPTFVSGASRNGAFVDVQINSSNQMLVIRRDRWGFEHSRYCVAFPGTIAVDRSAAASPSLGWSDAPYHTVSEAVNACAYDRFEECTNTVPIQIAAGSYPERMRIDRATKLSANGAAVHIGR